MTAMTETQKYDKIYTDSNEKMTLLHFYKEYPYKKRKCATCLPYVSIEDDSKHDYSLTYTEWKKIILSYFKHILLYLLNGYTYYFHSGMGEIRILRKKIIKKKVDIGRTILHFMKRNSKTREEAIEELKGTKERLYYFNPELNGYKWRVVWFRKGYNVKYLNLWGFMLQRQSAYKFVNEYLKKNPDTLFKLSEK